MKLTSSTMSSDAIRVEKRTKVDVKRNKMEPPDHSVEDGDPLADLVRDAGDPSKPSRFDILSSTIASTETTDENLMRIMEMLVDGSSSLLRSKRREKQTVEMLLRCPWAGRARPVVAVFVKAIATFLISNLWAVKDVLRSFVGQFVVKKADCATSALASSAEEEIEKRRKHDILFDDAHFVLETLFARIPGARHHILAILESSFPYKKSPTYAQECYVLNLLRLGDSQRDLRPRILQILIQRFVALDILAARVDILLSDYGDDAAASLTARIVVGSSRIDFIAPSSTASSSSAAATISSSSSSSSSPSQEYSLLTYHHIYAHGMNHKLAHTLDVLLLIFFDWLARKWKSSRRKEVKMEQTPRSPAKASSAGDEEGFNGLWRDLLSIFQSTILPSEKTSHVQFFMFYVCGLGRALTDAFLDYLWKRATDGCQPLVIRRAAVCYVASFVARAKICADFTLKAIFGNMIAWAERYCDQVESHVVEDRGSRDVGRHSIYYVICQAIFYIVVFRHKDVFKTSQSFRGISVKLKRLVDSALNPLNFCLPTVADNFALICSSYQLIDCFPIINENRRTRVPRYSERVVVGQTNHRHDDRDDDEDDDDKGNPLGAFFPFEPYLLTKSGPYINGNNSYLEFQGFPMKSKSYHHHDGSFADEEEMMDSNISGMEEEDSGIKDCEIKKEKVETGLTFHDVIDVDIDDDEENSFEDRHFLNEMILEV